MDDYNRRAQVLRVIDGDTVELAVDLGFHVWIHYSCRLYGIDCPERNTEEGKAARRFTETLLPVGMFVQVQTVKSDKYEGRFDGVIFLDTPKSGATVQKNINNMLVDAGLAVPYFGGAKRS